MFSKQILRLEFWSRDRDGTFRYIYVYANEKLVILEQNCYFNQKTAFLQNQMKFRNFSMFSQTIFAIQNSNFLFKNDQIHIFDPLFG